MLVYVVGETLAQKEKVFTLVEYFLVVHQMGRFLEMCIYLRVAVN